MALQQNEVVLFEHEHFAENGRVRHIIVTDKEVGILYSLPQIDFKDCMSSLRYNLDTGIVVTFYEDLDGGGRQYPVSGVGEDPSTHDNNFKDCASSFRWTRTAQ